MVKFQKNDTLEIKNEEIERKIKEKYELIDNETTLGYATINNDLKNLIYIYVKKEYRGNRIWKDVI